MGTLLVKFLTPKIQRLLAGLSSKAFQLQTDVAMQPFVGPVVLGMTGPATF